MKFDNILDCQNARKLEENFFKRSAIDSLSVIKNVGELMFDSFDKECFVGSASKKIMVLMGKGNNAADALAFLINAVKNYSECCIYIFHFFEESSRCENVKILLEDLKKSSSKIFEYGIEKLGEFSKCKFDITIEGIAALGFHSSIPDNFKEAIKIANSIDSNYKIAVDIPFGVSDKETNCAFCADYTYATGIAKDVIFNDFNACYVGRIRYLDLNFFECEESQNYQIYKEKDLEFFYKLRNAFSDKRDYGFLFVVGGSMEYKGAVLLNVKAALRSGVALLRAFVAEELASAFAVEEPSAMWTNCTLTPSGSLSLENAFLIKQYVDKASALLMGSGMTMNGETKAFELELLKNFDCPIILDADAITKENLEILKGRKNVLICPHNGEFLRIAKDCSNATLMQSAKDYGITIMLKGRYVRVCDGERIVINAMGSPALARGSTGDMLAGISASLLANKAFNLSPMQAALSGYAILSKASNRLAKLYGENGFAASDIIKELNLR